MIGDRWWFGIILTLCGTACARVGVPGPASPVPVDPGRRTMLAGFGRADITPPPGAGLFGYGPEGKVARGYRHRLYARALVLEDGSGERVALVTVDLGAISMLVQRRAAERTRDAGIGADRLVVAATHTHSAPGHYFGLAFDHFGTETFGFDRRLVDLLSTRIADAVLEAVAAMRPARLAWAVEPVWGFTRNRDLPAYQLNWPAPRRFAVPAGLAPEKAAVDPTWTLLRVDLRDPATGTYRPAGAFSIFAIHGTGNPSANDLYDGDIHAIVERALERHIDRLNGVARDSTTTATHLFANGAEGDVSPDWPPPTRCPVPTLRGGIDLDDPFDYPLLLEPENWVAPDPHAIARCLAESRRFIGEIGDSLGARATAIFDSLQPTDSMATIARVFEELRLKGRRSGGLCAKPEVGTATPSGVADGVTRYRVAGVPNVEEGGGSLDPTRSDCQWPKRTLFGDAQILLTDLITALPERAQFTVLRIGPMVLATVPAEITTTVGARVRQSVRTGLAKGGPLPDSLSIVGLANGYMYYVATREEYVQQHYAGSSTIYGPATADEIAAVLTSMAGRLPDAGSPSPPARVHGYSLKTGNFLFRLLGGSAHLIPDADQGPASIDFDARIDCAGDTLEFTWRDVYPGRLFRRPYPLVAVQERTGGAWVSRVWDDDRNVEIRATSPDGERGHWYTGRWSYPVRPSPGTELRVRLPADNDGQARLTPVCVVPPAP